MWRTVSVYLDGLAGQLEEVGRDGHHPRVFRVQRSQKCRRLAVEVLLVVDEALGEEGHIALVEVVDHGTLAAVFLDKRYPQLLPLDRVQHLHAQEGHRLDGLRDAGKRVGRRHI